MDLQVLVAVFSNIVFFGLGYSWGWDDCKRKVLPPRADNGQFMKRDCQ